VSLRWNNCLPIMHRRQGAPEEEISWADAMEDLERQKQMIQEQAKTQARPAAPESSTPKSSLSPGPELPNLQFIPRHSSAGHG
jgi:hypothetical protein